MKQQSILQSGCQGWHKNVIGSGGNQFAYCSTVGVYTHSYTDYTCKQLHTSHKRTITGLSWSKKDDDIYTTCSVDLKVRQFDVHKESEINSYDLPAKPVMLDYCAADDATNVVAVLVQPGAVHLWDTAAELDAFTLVEALPNEKLKCIRWDTTAEKPRLAAGHLDGSIYIWDKTLDSVANIPLPMDLQALREKTGNHDGYAVVDLQWDPLAPNAHLVATYENGYLALINVESLEVQTLFNRKNSHVEMTAFLPTIPGAFVSVDRRAAVLTVWNVSNPDSEEQFKISDKRSGITSIKCVGPDSTQLLIAFADGSVGLYDWVARRMLFTTQPGHNETIFDCAFQPSDCNVIATASYDSTVKVWHAPTMTHLNTMKAMTNENLGQFYSLSWAPPGENAHHLATSSSTGEVLIWNTQSQMLENRFKHHEKGVFRVSWHPTDYDLLASVSYDNYAVVFDSNGKVLSKFRHPNSVYGCAWSPFNKDHLATCCQDGVVRVWDITNASGKPEHEFVGHKCRAFNVAWSPLLEGYLASASDDSTVKVWKIGEEKAVHSLEQHTHNVRGLAWSHEIPYMLVSGSWDGKIILWDMRSRHQKCQHIITNHGGDVYGLASHPDRPFVFAACSRDTTLRLFSMDETALASFKYQIVLGNSYIQPEHLREAHKLLDPHAPLKLCGAKSRALAEQFGAVSEEDRENGACFASLMDYWNGARGLKELFSLAKSLVEEKAGELKGGEVAHVDDMRALLGARAEALLGTSVDMDGGHPHSRMEKAANIHLKLGNVKEYCEIQIKLGNWERAISVAPARSLAYWQELAARYSKHLRESKLLQAVPYLIATGDTKALIEYESQVLHATASDLTEALISAVGEATEVLPQPQDEEEEPEEEKKGGRDEVDITERVKMVMDLKAERYRHDAQPVMAAVCHLAVGDQQKAIQRLMLGGETVLAVILCKILKEDLDYVWKAVAQDCESLGIYHEALLALNQLAEPGNMITEMGIRFPGPAHEVSDFYLKAGLLSKEEFAEQAEAAVAKGATAEAVLSYAAARQSTKAADMGLEYIKKHLAAGTGSWDELKAVSDSLSSMGLCAETVKIEATARNEIIALQLLFALQTAIWNDYEPIVGFLADAYCKLTSDCELTLPVHGTQLKLMVASYLVPSDPARANTIVNECLADSASPPKVKAGATALKKTLDTSFADETPFPIPVEPTHRIIPSGAKFPGGSHAKASFISLVSGQPIQGERITLNDGSFISEAEARMLIGCTPLCPTLSGERLNTFGYQYLGPKTD